MKKLILLFMACAGLLACSGDDNENVADTPIELTQRNLQGTWVLNAKYFSGERQELTICEKLELWSFSDNIINAHFGYRFSENDACSEIDKTYFFTLENEGINIYTEDNPSITPIRVFNFTSKKLVLGTDDNSERKEYIKQE
jgi:hypothetical protein